MATRVTTHILKNSNVVNRPLPTSLMKGEAIVNTADGIMYFSGNTLSTSGWTAAGTGSTSTFFEVGSNLYDLSLRHRIIQYDGNSGANLVGKFLSGTSSGFVLANISAIAGSTAPVTGFTYSNNTFSILQSSGNLTASINSVTGLTVNGILSAQTYLGINTATGGTFSNGTITLLGTGNLSSITGIPDTKVTGGTFSNNILTLTNNTGGTVSTTINNFSGLTVNGVISATTISAITITSTDLNLNGLLKSYNSQSTLSGMFLSGTSNGFVLANISSIQTQDTYTTGFTYNSANNQLTIVQNNGQSSLNASINAVSGLTIANLTPNRMVYATTGGLLTTGNAIFDGVNMTLPTTGSLSVGTGGVSVSGDITVQGNLTVLGSSISAFTSQLYIEDNNIIVNYNPSGSTSGASIGAGLSVQDGNGTTGGIVTLDIRAMNGFTGLTASQIPSVTEYNGSTGFSNRAWVTQLNDIVIRSTNTTTPNGVRLVAEFDILDGGTY
jgi:hypothetical protein